MIPARAPDKLLTRMPRQSTWNSGPSIHWSFSVFLQHIELCKPSDAPSRYYNLVSHLASVLMSSFDIARSFIVWISSCRIDIRRLYSPYRSQLQLTVGVSDRIWSGFVPSHSSKAIVGAIVKTFVKCLWNRCRSSTVCLSQVFWG